MIGWRAQTTNNMRQQTWNLNCKQQWRRRTNQVEFSVFNKEMIIYGRGRKTGQPGSFWPVPLLAYQIQVGPGQPTWRKWVEKLNPCRNWAGWPTNFQFFFLQFRLAQFSIFQFYINPTMRSLRQNKSKQREEIE